MTPHTITAPVPAVTTPAAAERPGAARLLNAGVVAGPLFLIGWAAQAFTRAGFDPTYHPLSLLSLGALGWIQITNFVLTGVLYLVYAVGLRQALKGSPGATWAPRLVAAIGAGLIASGVFVTDPGAGFPPGAPSGPPVMSWHGALHEIGFTIVLLAWTVVCFVLRRRFTAMRQRAWARACVAAVLAAVVIGAWPDLHNLAIRLVAATAVQFGLLAAIAIHLHRAAPDARDPSGRSTL